MCVLTTVLYSYQVEDILDNRLREEEDEESGQEYLVKWKGYPDSDNTWVFEDDISSVLVKRYQRGQDVDEESDEEILAADDADLDEKHGSLNRMAKRGRKPGLNKQNNRTRLQGMKRAAKAGSKSRR